MWGRRAPFDSALQSSVPLRGIALRSGRLLASRCQNGSVLQVYEVPHTLSANSVCSAEKPTPAISALKRGNGLIQVSVNLQKELEPRPFQHLVHLGLGVEQLEMLLHPALDVLADGMNGAPPILWVR